MKVAVISDIHDNDHNLVLTLEKISNQEKVEQILFLGDFVGAAIARILVSCPVPTFAIWGNNDGDKVSITKFSLGKKSNLTVGFDTFDTYEIDRRKLFLTHYPLIAKPMARSGDFDAVLYGHDHLKNKEWIGNCLVLNPGEVGAYKTGVCSFAIYNTAENDAKIIEVENSITTNTELVKGTFEKIKLKWSQQKSHQVGLNNFVKLNITICIPCLNIYN